MCVVVLPPTVVPISEDAGHLPKNNFIYFSYFLTSYLDKEVNVRLSLGVVCWAISWPCTRIKGLQHINHV